MGIPTKEAIKALRKEAKLTQTESANLVYNDIRTWQQWESGGRAMREGCWELYRLKVIALKIEGQSLESFLLKIIK